VFAYNILTAWKVAPDCEVRLPKHKIAIITGVSGLGKSSLVFDTLASETLNTPIQQR